MEITLITIITTTKTTNLKTIQQNTITIMIVTTIMTTRHITIYISDIGMAIEAIGDGTIREHMLVLVMDTTIHSFTITIV